MHLASPATCQVRSGAVAANGAWPRPCSGLAAIDEIDGWIKNNRKQYASELAPKIGLPADVIERSVARSEIGARSIDAATLEGLQKIADTFAKLKLIPRSVNVAEVAWKVG